MSLPKQPAQPQTTTTGKFVEVWRNTLKPWRTILPGEQYTAQEEPKSYVPGQMIPTEEKIRPPNQAIGEVP